MSCETEADACLRRTDLSDSWPPAHVPQWPSPLLSGAAYGLMCTVMALIGDLTVSLMKRSAQIKDTGSLLPGHGGLLDRIDSYLLVAAPAYFFIKGFRIIGGFAP